MDLPRARVYCCLKKIGKCSKRLEKKHGRTQVMTGVYQAQFEAYVGEQIHWFEKGDVVCDFHYGEMKNKNPAFVPPRKRQQESLPILEPRKILRSGRTLASNSTTVDRQQDSIELEINESNFSFDQLHYSLDLDVPLQDASPTSPYFSPSPSPSLSTAAPPASSAPSSLTQDWSQGLISSLDYSTQQSQLSFMNDQNSAPFLPSQDSHDSQSQLDDISAPSCPLLLPSSHQKKVPFLSISQNTTVA
jgi:hypothetical protein